MKKSFIPLTALALFALVSCGPNPVESSSSSVDEPASSIDVPSSSVDKPSSSIDAPSSSVDVPSSSESKSSEDVVNSISITNKEELQAAWAVESANRTLSIAVDPAGNINLLINQGKITIVSSNPEVVRVTGRVLSAISAGTAKITVTYGDKSDSVDLTVSPAQNAINLYGTVHAGTATDPLDNADALKVAKATGTTATEKYFYVKGVVDSFRDAPSSYGNVSYYLKANSGDDAKFLVYRAVLSKDFKADGSTKVTDEDIWVGATVTAKVKIVNYNNSVPETEQGGEITKVEGEKITVNDIEATVAEAIAATKALDANATSVDNYIITGYIVATSSEGFYIADAKGAITPTKDDFLVYGYSGDNKDQCTLNAKVKVKCTLKYYVSTSEEGKYAVETGKVISVEILEAGDAPVVVEEIDVAKALEIVNGLEEGKTTEKEYAITGYVTEVTYAWSDEHKNMSYKIGASANAKDVLEVFRTKLADGVDSSKIVAGAKVKVTAYLNKYVKTTDGVKTVSLQATKGTTEFLSGAVGSTINATVAEAIAAANKLASGAVSADTYVITGYVAKVTNEWSAKFENMSVTLSDEIDDPDAKFIAFQVGCTEEVSKKIVAGAKVKVTGAVTNYNGTPETVNKGAAKIEFLEAASGTAVSASIASSALKIGETSQITASAGEGDTFTYASSDDAVATVSETGLVTAVAGGDARITITSSTGRKAYIEVSVAGSNEFMVTSFTA
ncbi:MAG: Ig-like domain-containing protein, partial [Candidatus Enteromonas sp.]|nr:Ig-like domain-containing protein [Candidatus Enteromonas sp.]